MTRDQLEAANWQALSAFLTEVSAKDARIAVAQARFIDQLTSNALAYASGQVTLALHPVREDPLPLLDKAIGVLAGAAGYPLRA